MNRRPATAKINLALVVGSMREDGKHDVATVLQRVALADRVAIRPSAGLHVRGYAGDTLVREALGALAVAAGVDADWEATITKRIPVGSGLGGGSSDAATALRLANATLRDPLPAARLLELARGIGADVPFFLGDGPMLGEGDGSELTPLQLPQDYYVLLVLRAGEQKRSTASVYSAFDDRNDAKGFRNRRAALRRALVAVETARDLAALPPNDLAASPLAADLLAQGAFRADVSGAGPAVYGLFTRREDAVAARWAFDPVGRTWLTVPAWYG